MTASGNERRPSPLAASGNGRRSSQLVHKVNIRKRLVPSLPNHCVGNVGNSCKGENDDSDLLTFLKFFFLSCLTVPFILVGMLKVCLSLLVVGKRNPPK